MMQVVNRREAAGLIERSPDSSHGRILRTAITPKGPRDGDLGRPWTVVLGVQSVASPVVVAEHRVEDDRRLAIAAESLNATLEIES